MAIIERDQRWYLERFARSKPVVEEKMLGLYADTKDGTVFGPRISPLGPHGMDVEYGKDGKDFRERLYREQITALRLTVPAPLLALVLGIKARTIVWEDKEYNTISR